MRFPADESSSLRSPHGDRPSEEVSREQRYAMYSGCDIRPRATRQLSHGPCLSRNTCGALRLVPTAFQAISDASIFDKEIAMTNEFSDLPTNILLELVVAILDAGRPLNFREGAQLEKLGCELQRRMQSHGWVC